MTLEQYLLSRLTEECMEVGFSNSKANNFGLESFDPKDVNKETNRQSIVKELNDILGVVELLVEQEILPENWKNQDLIEAKKEKVVKYMEISQENGKLDKGFKPSSLIKTYKQPTQLEEDIYV